MEVTDYCKNLTMELTAWKAKMYDLGRKLDRMSTGQKEKVFPEVNELHMIIEELGQRIEKLQKECPTKWDPSEINDKIDDLRIKLDETWDSVSPSDIGG
jgi:predicted nuclease with TOPRIM domain